MPHDASENQIFIIPPIFSKSVMNGQNLGSYQEIECLNLRYMYEKQFVIPRVARFIMLSVKSLRGIKSHLDFTIMFVKLWLTEMTSHGALVWPLRD